MLFETRAKTLKMSPAEFCFLESLVDKSLSKIGFSRDSWVTVCVRSGKATEQTLWEPLDYAPPGYRRAFFDSVDGSAARDTVTSALRVIFSD